MARSLRDPSIGLLVGIPFAAVAWLVAQAVLGGTMAIGSRFEAFLPLISVGPVAAPAAAIGVLVASTLVATRLGQPWADQLGSALRFIALGHLVAAAVASVLILAGGTGDVSRAGDALLKLVTTFVATSWAWVVGAGIWVAAAGKAIRRDAPATPEETASSLEQLAQQTRTHITHDATTPGDQGARVRQAR